MARRFIQNQDFRIKDQRTGETDQLAFSTRKLIAFFNDWMMDAFFVAAQKVVSADLFQGIDNHRFGDRWIVHSDVAGDRSSK